MTLTEENEHKIQNFVKNEVFANVNDFVEFSLQKSIEGDTEAPISLDDFENLYKLPEYYGNYARFEGGTEEDRDEEIERLEEMRDESELQGNSPAIDADIDDLNQIEAEPQEIFEYWMVSEFMANDLIEKGEPIAKLGNMNIWGRTCAGQAIAGDEVIQQIFKELNK